MKTQNNQTLLAAVFTATLAVSTAYSQPVVTVDEFGNGNISGSPIPSAMAVDPFSGMTTLSYTLPYPAVQGDVVLQNTSGTISDVYRFDGSFTLYVYSDIDLSEPNPSPADVGFPASLLGTSIFLVETGAEPPSGYSGYNAGFFNPGANSAGATYTFISDVAPAPEPGSLALLAGGLGIFGFGFLRRKLEKSIKSFLTAGFITTVAVTSAFSQPVINIDEFGNGNISGSPIPSAMATDPFSGMTTLSYTLPFPAIRGDVVLSDVLGTVSDILRFDGSFTLYVYSDTTAELTPASPADVGFPGAIQPSPVFATETGSEPGLNGLFGYNPGTTLPGGNTAGATYNFISDPAPAPEPSSLALLGGGILGFGLLSRKLARD